jgi:branched-chain amino acid aminotransferase
MPILVNVEGRLVPPEQAFVSVFDRGFLYGDSVYEVARTYGGRPFELGKHLDRMDRSAERIGLVLPPRKAIESEIQRTLDAAKNPESYVRVVVTRGEGKFGLSPHYAEGLSRLFVIVRPLEPAPREHYERGLKVAVTLTRRNPVACLDPSLKTGNYMNNILALREAHAAGADDALLLDLRGKVTEASTSNIFFVQQGVVVTPPLALGMLQGVTRTVVMDVARGEGLIVREEPFGPEALGAADEVFVTSTIREIMPVTSLVLLGGPAADVRRIADGKQGPVTRRLHEAFNRYVARTHGA